MKNIIKILVIAILITSCEDTQPVLFDGTTAVGFQDSLIEVSVPEEGVVANVEVTSTTVSSQDRTFDAEYVQLTPGSADEWLPLPQSNLTIGSINIPAGEYVGSVDVGIDNTGLEDFVQYRFQVAVDVEGSAFPPVTFFVLKQFDITTFVCTDLQLIINLDNFSSENTWELTDSSGAVVYSGGPYEDGRRGETEIVNGITLDTGCYTFEFFDSYGDGLFDGVVDGDYSLVCAEQSVVVYASGTGNFGDSNSTDFCIN